MNVLYINGSPRSKGKVASIMRMINEASAFKHNTDWIDVYSMKMMPCRGCMKCRDTGICILPRDDAHMAGEKISRADILIIGTPTYWGNMSSMLKMLFERNVPLFMGESKRGLPLPMQKGKHGVIISACTTPWPFSSLFNQSRGAIKAVKEVLHYGGYKILDTLECP